METTGSIHFLNIEYFFRLLYDALVGSPGAGAAPDYGILLAAIWIIVTGMAYIITLGFLGVLVYATIRIHQTREEEEHEYSTIQPDHAEKEIEHSRWAHIQTLIESPNESDWRQAIIEADIILDDTLSQHGYLGQSVGEKLKQANPQKFHTLQDAWEAHKVRNEIAHQGSSYKLSGQIAYRTIGRYMNVFEEFMVI